MKRLFVTIFWTIICALIFFLGIIIPEIIISCLILIFAIFAWRLIKYKNYRQSQNSQIPQNVLQDFEEIERRWIESDNQTEPHEIFWEFARSKQRGLRAANQTEPAIAERVVQSSTVKRSELPSSLVTRSSKDRISNSRVKRDNSKFLFGKRI